MDVRNIAVVVEDVDAARTALLWALHNIIRYGDIITLIHVYPLTRTKTKNKARLLRLKGFQLALSFQEICNNFSNVYIQIHVSISFFFLNSELISYCYCVSIMNDACSN